MPYPGRRAHHLRGIRRRHHRAGYRDRDRVRRRRRRVYFSPFRGGINTNFVRNRRILPWRRRRRLRGLRAVTFPFRAAAKLAALYKLLNKKKKKTSASGAGAAGAGASRSNAGTRLRHARGTPRPNPRPGVGTPHPMFFFFPPFPPHRFPRRLRHLRVRRYAVMTTNFGGDILAPVYGPAYRTGATTGLRPAYGVGQRPRRSRYQTGRGPRLPQLHTSRISSRRSR